MTLTLIAGPAAPPVSDADLAEHARLAQAIGETIGETSGDLPALIRCRDAAVAAVERACATALIRQTWDWRLRDWPDPSATPLPISPVLSIVSVERLSPDGTADPLAPETYALDRTGPRPAIRAVSNLLPSPPRGGGVSIRFQAGHGDAPTDVPADLRQAVLLLAAHYFERRHAADEAALAPIPHGVSALLEPHRPARLG